MHVMSFWKGHALKGKTLLPWGASPELARDNESTRIGDFDLCTTVYNAHSGGLFQNLHPSRLINGSDVRLQIVSRTNLFRWDYADT